VLKASLIFPIPPDFLNLYQIFTFPLWRLHGKELTYQTEKKNHMGIIPVYELHEKNNKRNTDILI